MAGWDGRVAQEAAWLREAGARLVLGDIPPLAFAAAAEPGLPSVALGNFSWDWIYGHLAARVPALAEAAARAARVVRARGPAAAAAVRGRPVGVPPDRGRAARRSRSRRWRRPRRADAWGSTSAPPSSSRSAALGLPGLRPAGFRVAGRVPVPAHRPSGGTARSRRISGGSTAPALDAAGPRLPGPRRRRRRRGDQAGLRHRHRLHRRRDAARLHRPRRLPGVPGDGRGDAALPAGRLRVERGRAGGPARSRARGRARAAVPRSAAHRRRVASPPRSCSSGCRSVSRGRSCDGPGSVGLLAPRRRTRRSPSG